LALKCVYAGMIFDWIQFKSLALKCVYAGMIFDWIQLNLTLLNSLFRIRNGSG